MERVKEVFVSIFGILLVFGGMERVSQIWVLVDGGGGGGGEVGCLFYPLKSMVHLPKSTFHITFSSKESNSIFSHVCAN